MKLGDKIRALREAKGWTQQRLADECGWKGQNRVSNYERGVRPVGLIDLAVLAGALDSSVTDLLAGTETDSPVLGTTPVIAWKHPDDLGGDIDPYVFVPRVEIRASAGNGRPIVEPSRTDERQPQAFRADWIRSKGWKPANLVCMFADGHSMSPRIEDGDCLLIDRAQTQVLDGRIYALAWDHEMRVKRLYKRVGGGLIVHSDNEREHPRFELSDEQLQHVVIVGRVVWIGGDV